MPNYLLRLLHPTTGEKFYCEWSTVVDAPVCVYAGIKDVREHLLGEATRDHDQALHAVTDLNLQRDIEVEKAAAISQVERRLMRLHERGITALHTSATPEEFVAHNHAGKNGSCLTVAQIIDTYRHEMVQEGK